MKIVHLSSNEGNAGAAKAAIRIHKQCIINNIDSKFIVQNKISNDNNVIDIKRYHNIFLTAKINSRLNALPLKFYKLKEKNNWSTSFLSYAKVDNIKEIKQADIVIIYWVCEGFLSISEIKKLLSLGKPIIWRFSDMWPFTGGCHYSYSCNKYAHDCEKCPQLNSNSKYDLSNHIFNKKLKLWKNLENLTIIAPSTWMSDCVKKSRIFKNANVNIIPTGVDLNIFKDWGYRNLRSSLNLPTDKKLILFGSINPSKDNRKGGTYLYRALSLFKKNCDTDLVIFGSNNSQEINENFKVHNLGFINDDKKMAMIYSTCDIFVAPALEENLANTVIEAMACGTIVVAFNVGGMKDIIDHKINGYLANPYEISDLKKGIDWALSVSNKIKTKVKNKIKNKFSQQTAFSLYKKLFLEVLNK